MRILSLITPVADQAGNGSGLPIKGPTSRGDPDDLEAKGAWGYISWLEVIGTNETWFILMQR